MNMRVLLVMLCTFLITVVHCCSASCGVLLKDMTDAPNTQLSHVSSFPWLVSIKEQGGSHLAVGTIISEFWIVTAPSALKLRKGLTVVVGDITKPTMDLYSRDSYVIHKVIVHEEFNEILHSNDLMLLMTKNKIRFGYTVQPICFPSLDPHNSALSNCTVTGWTGLTDAGHVSSISWCAFSVENMNPCPLQRTASTDCCIHRGHHDPNCLGTGGSPVSCQVKAKERWLLAGVLPRDGMRPYVPVLYTRTSYYSDWIISRTTEAGEPFFPTISVNTLVLPHDTFHFRSAQKSQPQKDENEEVLYDYYNGNDVPKAHGNSLISDVCLIIFVMLLAE